MRFARPGLKLGVYYSPINWRYPGYYDVTGTRAARNKWNYRTIRPTRKTRG